MDVASKKNKADSALDIGHNLQLQDQEVRVGQNYFDELTYV